jgi:hypothetical protein
MHEMSSWPHAVTKAVTAVFCGVDRDELLAVLHECAHGDTMRIDVALDVRGASRLVGGPGPWELHVGFFDGDDDAAIDPVVIALENTLAELATPPLSAIS